MKKTMETELLSLSRGKYLGLSPVYPQCYPVGFKWVFIRKRDANNVVMRYKARLLAQVFTLKPDIDYDETYSLVMSEKMF